MGIIKGIPNSNRRISVVAAQEKTKMAWGLESFKATKTGVELTWNKQGDQYYFECDQIQSVTNMFQLDIPDCIPKGKIGVTFIFERNPTKLKLQTLEICSF